MRDYEENTVATNSYFTQPVLTRLVSKKFIVFIIVLITLLMMLYTGQITGTNVTELLYIFVPSYFGTDIVQNTAITHIESKERTHRRKTQSSRSLFPETTEAKHVHPDKIPVHDVIDKPSVKVSAPKHTEPVAEESSKPKRVRLKPIKR